MISRLSDFIANALCKSSTIGESDKELYVYVFFVLLSQVFSFLMTALFGLILGTLWESIVFYIMFSTLRSYAGGFHASKESVCTVCTTAALFITALILSWFKQSGSFAIPFCMLVFGSAVVYLLSPLDSEDKPLSFNEFLDYRRRSRIISMVIAVIAVIGWLLNLPGLLYSAATSVFLESILLFLGEVSAQKKR